MKLDRDEKNNSVYVRVLDTPTSYSLEIEEGVIGDYDQSGALVGIEVVGSGSSETDFTHLLNKARSRSKGPKKRGSRTLE